MLSIQIIIIITKVLRTTKSESGKYKEKKKVVEEIAWSLKTISGESGGLVIAGESR